MEARVALKRKQKQEKEDALGDSSSGIIRDGIQQFVGGSSRPMAGGSRAPMNRDAETQNTTETHDAETQTGPIEFPFRW